MIGLETCYIASIDQEINTFYFKKKKKRERERERLIHLINSMVNL